MSQKQLQRLRVIEKAVDGRLSVSEAAHLLGRSERQVQRLKRRFQPDSTDWLMHGNTGRAMPWDSRCCASVAVEGDGPPCGDGLP